MLEKLRLVCRVSRGSSQVSKMIVLLEMHGNFEVMGRRIWILNLGLNPRYEGLRTISS